LFCNFLLGHAETFKAMTFFHFARELQFHAFYNLFTHHLFTKEISLADFFFLPLSLINILTKVKVKTQPDWAQKKNKQTSKFLAKKVFMLKKPKPILVFNRWTLTKVKSFFKFSSAVWHFDTAKKLMNW
jgi:hypothetical protein